MRWLLLGGRIGLGLVGLTAAGVATLECVPRYFEYKNDRRRSLALSQASLRSALSAAKPVQHATSISPQQGPISPTASTQPMSSPQPAVSEQAVPPNAQAELEAMFRPLPTRATQLARLRNEQFDVLVIGGGATGSGVALDAQTRGLRTALVEKYDFSSGTSSRSTKLIHGGVRYLQKAIMSLDYEQVSCILSFLYHISHHNLPSALRCFKCTFCLAELYRTFC